jgi:hypothetical protein
VLCGISATSTVQQKAQAMIRFGLKRLNMKGPEVGTGDNGFEPEVIIIFYYIICYNRL